MLLAAPLVLAGLVAGALLLLGEQRMLQVSMSLWGVTIVGGVVVSAIVGVVLWGQRMRQGAARRIAVARAEGLAAGEHSAREGHRLFLARLDHELKNPLTAIRATAAGRPAEEWVRVDRQAERLSDLVRDLRKLAELETCTLEQESVDLEALVRESMDALVQRHPLVQQRLRFEVSRVPWPVPMISGDLDLLSVTMDNLLGNAVKYACDGLIEVRLREEDGWVVLEVADSGRGIPEADLPFVFDELARAGNAHDVAGSGLGLALVATVVARHGGDVTARSIVGTGTVMSLRLPANGSQSS